MEQSTGWKPQWEPSQMLKPMWNSWDTSRNGQFWCFPWLNLSDKLVSHTAPLPLPQKKKHRWVGPENVAITALESLLRPKFTKMGIRLSHFPLFSCRLFGILSSLKKGQTLLRFSFSQRISSKCWAAQRLR